MEGHSASTGTEEVTRLLVAWRDGRAGVADRLFPLIYDELRRIARRQLRRERQGHTLSTTALVHEAYLRLVDQTRLFSTDRVHFYAIAARAMRRILVDHARQRYAQKRGGKQTPLPLDEERMGAKEQATLMLALDHALERLGKRNQRLSQVVECRFFGGLTEEETAAVLDVSPRTVRRDWAKARAWLYKELRPSDS